LEMIVPVPVSANLEALGDKPSTSDTKYLIVFERANPIIVGGPDIPSIGTDFKFGRRKCWTWSRTGTWARLRARLRTRRLRLRKQRRRCECKGEQNQANK